MRRALLLLAAATLTRGIDNGYGLTPPMGWRSWNCFHAFVDQGRMERTMDKMAQRTRTVDGRPTSLVDLGYTSCGLDDAWQACHFGVNGSFHSADGAPLVDRLLFPDMKRMTDHGHAKGIKVGWYMNNCICKEQGSWVGAANLRRHMERSAQAVADYGFDGVKLDGCGEFLNLTWWAELLNQTGRRVMIENCHWGRTVPGAGQGGRQPVMHQGELRSADAGPSQADGPCSGTTMPSDCPYNFYRTSGDITNTWDSMLANLHSTIPFQGDPPLSRPGAWAYPDMLEVGRIPSRAADRSHFGAWVITSSPLILGYNLLEEANTDKVWDIIANPEAIAVNQAWAGHPGRRVKAGQVELWTKPLGSGRLAAFLLNTGTAAPAQLSLTAVGFPGGATVRDVWNRKDLGRAQGSINATLGEHDSAFYVLSP
eukprot:TRINITY_DN157_c0_g1_i2.p1 TRINITY_DN157_c0_g1~~TRINITY_DN157_c0_g1_i2.p1  ORF type:complete len:447 (+),score=168.08 TRINITY_DN157_c0_g1_i2:68-1342(+)